MSNVEYPVVNGWIVYRIREGKAEFFSILQTETIAKGEIALLNERTLTDGAPEWQFAKVAMLGWGQVAPGVFGQNGPPPLKVVEGEKGQA
jgi:hypothetical protein